MTSRYTNFLWFTEAANGGVPKKIVLKISQNSQRTPVSESLFK